MKRKPKFATGQNDPEHDHPTGWQPTLHALMNSLPTGYPERVTAMKHLRKVFQGELAVALEPSLRTFIDQEQALIRSGETRWKSERALGAHVCHDLHMLGLAIRHPTTSRPATLLVQPLGHDRGHAHRFVIQPPNPDDGAAVASTGEAWPRLELVDNPPRPKPLDSWLRARETRSR